MAMELGMCCGETAGCASRIWRPEAAQQSAFQQPVAPTVPLQPLQSQAAASCFPHVLRRSAAGSTSSSRMPCQWRSDISSPGSVTATDAAIRCHTALECDCSLPRSGASHAVLIQHSCCHRRRRRHPLTNCSQECEPQLAQKRRQPGCSDPSAYCRRWRCHPLPD